MRAPWFLLLAAACNGGSNDDDDDDDDGPATIEGVYRACAVVEDCQLDHVETPVCIDKGGSGYCTWECLEDADCDETAEQSEGFDLVCASFESEAEQYCFPSCEVVPDTGGDGCPPGFGCRSTGGGSNNRKVCFPEALGTTTTTTVTPPP